jgi:nitric oxide dioxygenase
MSREIEEGSEVWIKMPFGQFFVEPSTELETVLIAGGTGITPYISFLELSCDMLLPKGIRLFYGIRSGKYLLYKNTIDKCKLKLEDFNNWLFSESGDELGDMDYIQGRLDIEAIWELTPAPFKSTFYISGPPLMLRNFIRSLHNRGVNPDRVITDDWE